MTSVTWQVNMDDFVSQAGAGYSQKDRTITHKNKDRVPTGRAGNFLTAPFLTNTWPVAIAAAG